MRLLSILVFFMLRLAAFPRPEAQSGDGKQSAQAGVPVLRAQSGNGKGSADKPGPSPATKSSAAMPATPPARGKEVYRMSCGICHFETSAQKKIGPGLKGIYKRGKFADGKGVDDKAMRAWIESGGKDMPPFRDVLTSAQIADLIAYLKTL